MENSRFRSRRVGHVDVKRHIAIDTIDEGIVCCVEHDRS